MNITQFYKEYPDDNTCLHKLFVMKYGNAKECPCCKKETKFYRVKTKSSRRRMQRKCYECKWCGHQLYPLAGTIFSKTTTPLTSWFYAIFLFSTTKNGVAAKELQRQLGVTYKTAWRMGHKIRWMLGNKQSLIMETGVIQIDETYVGGKIKNRHWYERGETKMKKNDNKIPVFGMLQENGKVIAEVIPKARKSIMIPILKEIVFSGCTIVSDSLAAYSKLKKHYKQHVIVNHKNKEYIKNGYHTNSIECFWAQLKRMIHGTHIKVSKQHLQKYVDEVVFRFNNRDRPEEMFNVMMEKAV